MHGLAVASRIINEVDDAGGMLLFVGGFVRDKLMGIKSKDIDIEVYGLTVEQLVSILSQFGKVDCVGVSFGVIKLTTPEGDDFDFSLPRKDNEVSDGHKGFEIIVDHTLTPKEAALRRDFTINSIGMKLDGEIIDPYGGQEDIKHRTLRPTSKHFIEDPLRVLRGFQFAGRFEMKACKETSEMCHSLLSEASALSHERVFGEVIKWALKSKKPSMGLQFLVDTGWISIFPELEQLINLPQDAEWHPEGDVFSHTCLVVDHAAEVAKRDDLSDSDRLVLIFSALCHDLGKAITTKMIDGRWRAPKHAEAGVDLTESLMRRMGFVGDSDLRKVISQVQQLVKYHMVHISSKVSDRFVRRLSRKVSPSSIAQLVRVMECDYSGRTPLPKGTPVSALEILYKSELLKVDQTMPSEIIKGRHLLELGIEPGPQVGKIVKDMYERQLNGDFHTEEEGREVLKAIL